MAKCNWCGREEAKLQSIMQLGNTYQVCSKCYQSAQDEVCIKCGNAIVGQGGMNGLCAGCAQEVYENKQRKLEEIANGVAVELLEEYSTGIDLTEEDYNRWVTFGQGTFTPQYLKQCRHNWIRKKLVINGGWDKDFVEERLDDIEELFNRHLSKVMNGKYMIIRYNPKVSKQRIREFVDHIGEVFIVEKK